MKNSLVQEWMTPEPVTIPSSTTITDAHWTMIDNKIRRLLVVDEGELVGIITLQDLQQKIPFASLAINPLRASNYLTKCPVRQLMSPDPVTISLDTTLVDAAKLMLERKISTLPVMDRDRLVGIITESDVFRAFVKTAEAT